MVAAAVDVVVVAWCDVKLAVSYVADLALVSGSVVVTIHSEVDSVVVPIEVDLLLVLLISGGPLRDVSGPDESTCCFLNSGRGSSLCSRGSALHGRASLWSKGGSLLGCDGCLCSRSGSLLSFYQLREKVFYS